MYEDARVEYPTRLRRRIKSSSGERPTDRYSEMRAANCADGVEENMF